MNSAFHSSGTAIGNVEMMNTWKHDHQHDGGHGDGRVMREQQDQRHHELDERAAHVGQADGPLGRPQIVGKLR